MKKNFIDVVTSLAKDIAAEYSCSLVDVEYKKEGRDKILRVYAEKLDDRISLDDLSNISKSLSDAIDTCEEAQTEENYILEVSSPGVNRVLKSPDDYIRFSGEKVDVSLYENMNGAKKFTAQLNGYNAENNSLSFQLPEGIAEIQLDKISKICLHFEF